jgi:succinate dehydrogenase / fumarate reductase iron-sulfur subunit
MNLTLKIWRQSGPKAKGEYKTYVLKDISEHMSFLEMLDVLNRDLVLKSEDPVAFDHDCREGICGSCSLVINGTPHGPEKGTATCQLHMRHFRDGEEIYVEPYRANAFPIIKDCFVDRSAFDRIVQAGGYISINTGNAPESNSVPVPKSDADAAFAAAACISCGACVAACKNRSAALFVGAKITHLGLLPQGQPERYERVTRMVKTMDEAGFGACSNTGACSAVCPKGISLSTIAQLNRDLLIATVRNGNREEEASGGFG